jgi:hypothetical protein
VKATWGKACVYKECSPHNPTECLHQAISVNVSGTGSQVINATLFSGYGCNPNQLTDNFNDGFPGLSGSGIWIFTNHGAVPPVSATDPETSAIWWVGNEPFTRDGYPPSDEPSSGCVNYGLTTPPCQ